MFVYDSSTSTVIGPTATSGTPPPKTGFPYPPDGHVSAMAYRQPGWIFVSTYGHT